MNRRAFAGALRLKWGCYCGTAELPILVSSLQCVNQGEKAASYCGGGILERERERERERETEQKRSGIKSVRYSSRW